MICYNIFSVSMTTSYQYAYYATFISYTDIINMLTTYTHINWKQRKIMTSYLIGRYTLPKIEAFVI